MLVSTEMELMANDTEILTPLTNLTCVIDKLEGSLAHHNLTTATDLGVTSAMIQEAAGAGCQMQSPPYFPEGASLWVKTVFVALLGSVQQFALIGEPHIVFF